MERSSSTSLARSTTSASTQRTGNQPSEKWRTAASVSSKHTCHGTSTSHAKASTTSTDSPTSSVGSNLSTNTIYTSSSDQVPSFVVNGISVASHTGFTKKNPFNTVAQIPSTSNTSMSGSQSSSTNSSPISTSTVDASSWFKLKTSTDPSTPVIKPTFNTSSTSFAQPSDLTFNFLQLTAQPKQCFNAARLFHKRTRLSTSEVIPQAPSNSSADGMADTVRT